VHAAYPCCPQCSVNDSGCAGIGNLVICANLSPKGIRRRSLGSRREPLENTQCNSFDRLPSEKVTPVKTKTLVEADFLFFLSALFEPP
jgi:hypothetical protein